MPNAAAVVHCVAVFYPGYVLLAIREYTYSIFIIGARDDAGIGSRCDGY